MRTLTVPKGAPYLYCLLIWAIITMKNISLIKCDLLSSCEMHDFTVITSTTICTALRYCKRSIAFHIPRFVFVIIPWYEYCIFLMSSVICILYSGSSNECNRCRWYFKRKGVNSFELQQNMLASDVVSLCETMQEYEPESHDESHKTEQIKRKSIWYELFAIMALHHCSVIFIKWVQWILIQITCNT